MTGRQAIRVAGAMLTLTAFPLLAQQPVFRSSADSVVVDVSVRQQGEAVLDLTARDFELRDNGVVQTVTDVSREMLPVDVTFIIDLSGSITEPLLVSLTHGVQAVGARLRPADRASVVTFDQRVREISGLRAGGDALTNLRLQPEGGSTSLLDAVAVSLLRPLEANRRHMAIVFTDGKDVTSFLDEREVADVAARSGMTVFAVGVVDGMALMPQSRPDYALLQTLATTTGGVLTLLPRGRQELGPSFVQAFEDFRTSYVLRYTPTGAARAGWHELGVRIARPGTFDVRARKGYFEAAAVTQGP